MARRIFLSALLVVLVFMTPVMCLEWCDDDASGCPHAQFALAVDVPGASPLLGVRCAAAPLSSSFASPFVYDVFHVPLLG
jgi:hypothetical protein